MKHTEIIEGLDELFKAAVEIKDTSTALRVVDSMLMVEATDASRKEAKPV